MASVVSPYLAILAHPVYPWRSAIINALTLEDAQALAAARVAGTQWFVFDVQPSVVTPQ
jgi:hypothetical protein